MKITNRKDVLKVTFSGLLDAKNLVDTTPKILAAFKKLPKKVVVELGKYEKLDFSFIQLLLVLKNELKTKEQISSFQLNFSGEDSELLSRLNILNLLQTKSKK